MRNAFKLLLAALLLPVLVLAQDAPSVKIPDAAVTPARLKLIQTLLEEQIRTQGVKATQQSLGAAVVTQFTSSSAELRNAGREPYIDEVDTLRVADEKLRAAAQEKYPEYTNDELVRQSEKLFPLYRKGERVTIRIRTNPRKTEKISGYYNGMHGGNIAIGPTNYRLADMSGIVGNDGPHGEIAKFDVNLNRMYRREWREEYARTSTVKRTGFIEENKEKFNEAQHEEDFLENERRGYTYFLEKWLSPKELVEECAYIAASMANRAFNEKTRQEMELRFNDLQAQRDMTAYGSKISPDGAYPSAEKVLADEAAAQKRREELKAQREQEIAMMAARAEEEARQAELKRQRDRERRAREATQQAVQAEDEGISMTTYVIVAVIVVLALVGGGWWWNTMRKEDDLDVSKFFEGKGKLQQEFWDAANADPDHFKYVAYLFPDMASARDALERLSYISEDEYGNIVSKKKDLRYGCYEHQNGAVAFVGSPTLNYASWREASMIWPDIPLSNYFKVSSEPIVSMLLPDLDKMRAQGIQVEGLGTEDVRTETGEVNRIYRFKVPTKEDAIKFLGNIDITEEGLVVRVETNEGVFGKDINGVFAA